LFEGERHERLHGRDWSETLARQTIEQICDDTIDSFTPEKLWPVHPLDWPEATEPYRMLYLGAAGVMWSLNHFEQIGVLNGQAPDFSEVWPDVLESNRTMISAMNHGTQSLWMGDSGILLPMWLDDPSESVADALKAAVGDNRANPALDFMWGSPGTMLAALTMHERTGDEYWATLFRESTAALWQELKRDEQFDCLLWTQDLYGTRSKYVGAGHGFVGNVFPVIRGRELLSGTDWARWQSCIEQTVSATAIREDGCANWPPLIDPTTFERTELLVQYCHGAPGVITCLAELPSESIDSLLLEGGELTWKAGPLSKGAGLCHGTAGNGYAFLKLFARSGDEIWLDRARAFAMHSIGQYEGHCREYGCGRYSLWTGDQGLALYLWSCIEADDAFPTMDFF
jgi:hypothetical protein